VPASLAVLLLTAGNVWGQTNDNTDAGGRRNRRRGNAGNQAQRDPAQAREQMMTRIRERLEIKSDDDWKNIQPLIEKVQQAQREARVSNLGGRRGGNANTNGNTGDTNNNNGNNNRRNRPNGEETPTDPDVVALRTALDSNAPLSELKPKLAKVRELIKQRAVALAKAQEDLRQALTPRQEAIASLLGLLR
jgi:hypothetical protein